MTASFRNVIDGPLKRINDAFKISGKNKKSQQLSAEVELAEAERLYEQGRAKASEGKYKTAIQAYHGALAIQRRHLGNDCPEAGRTLNAIGVALMESGRGADCEGEQDFAALTAFEEALHIRQTACGDGSEEAAETMCNLWTLLDRVRRREERDEGADNSTSAEQADDGEPELAGSDSSEQQPKSSVSAHSNRKTRRLSVTIASAIREGRRRSSVVLDISNRKKAMLEEGIVPGDAAAAPADLDDSTSDWKV